VAAAAALERAVGLLERIEWPSTRLLSVLAYHRVDWGAARPELDPRLISAMPDEFERQMYWLARNANPLTLDEVLNVRDGIAVLPRRAVLVTFDDAYRDFAEHAWPIMRRYGVPATLFVPTAYPGRRQRCFWWDRLHAALMGADRLQPLQTPAGRLTLATLDDRRRAHRLLSRWLAAAPPDAAMALVESICSALGEPRLRSPILTWPALRKLHADGVTLAPHSRTHARLDQLPVERAWQEIAGSRDDLERQLGVACPPAFAFPGGGHSERLSEILRHEAFEVALTMRRGPNDIGRVDWLRMRRTNVGRRTNLAALRAQLMRWPGNAAKAVAAVRS
jgi:peptidoglycan/xylan/chitin deacetylase (PgdA/CDA1 family)